MRDADVHQAIGTIYDAVLDERAWPRAMASLCRLLGGASGSLITHDLNAQRPLFFLDHNLDPAEWTRYAGHYCTVDLWRDAVAGLEAGRVAASDQVVDRKSFEASEWYNDFLGPIDIGQATFGVCQKNARQLSAVAIYRPLAAEPATAIQCRAYGVLLPHLDRALQQRARLLEAAQMQDLGSGALDQLSSGVIIAAPDGRVLQINAKAEALLQQNDGIVLKQGKLTLAQRHEALRLLSLLAAAARTSAGEAFDTGGALAISRPSGKRPFGALVAPLGTRDGRDLRGIPSGRKLAVIYLSDPKTQPQMPVDLLQALYGLTAAEACCVASLAGGQSPNDQAAASRRSPETVRRHLKVAMAKTETHSQVELMRLVMSSVPVP